MGCSQNLEYYKQIKSDLLQFQEIPKFLKRRTNAVRYSFRDGKLTKGHYEAFKSPLPDLDRLFGGFDRFLTQSFDILINKMDEPMSLTYESPFSSPYDIQKVKCVQEKFGKGNNLTKAAPIYNHGFFTIPGTFQASNEKFPVFSQTKLDCFNDIMMPMSYHLVKPTKDKNLFQDKRNVVFWRGTNTGGRSTDSGEWRNFSRIRLLDWEKGFHQKHPLQTFSTYESDPNPFYYAVDIGLSDVVQCDHATCQQIKREYPLRKYVGFKKTLEYKYLPVLDGNTWPARLQVYLQTNSVILYNGIFRDWFNGILEPWKHYVPFAIDASDLEERIEWLESHQMEAEQISRNARELMQILARPAQMKCYTGLLLLEYESRLV
ncbi:glycosyl transferase family 90-domain-containing protein [Gorgonomyces haynaldii]|nr:glycosyl transferase family 90-domain-containing protein [Gorgonomyces haynaldii]